MCGRGVAYRAARHCRVNVAGRVGTVAFCDHPAAFNLSDEEWAVVEPLLPPVTEDTTGWRSTAQGRRARDPLFGVQRLHLAGAASGLPALAHGV